MRERRLSRSRPRIAGAAAGDLLAVMSAGAYGAVQAGTYNSRLLIPEVLVKGGALRGRPAAPDLRRVDRPGQTSALVGSEARLQRPTDGRTARRSADLKQAEHSRARPAPARRLDASGASRRSGACLASASGRRSPGRRAGRAVSRRSPGSGSGSRRRARRGSAASSLFARRPRRRAGAAGSAAPAARARKRWRASTATARAPHRPASSLRRPARQRRATSRPRRALGAASARGSRGRSTRLALGRSRAAAWPSAIRARCDSPPCCSRLAAGWSPDRSATRASPPRSIGAARRRRAAAARLDAWIDPPRLHQQTADPVRRRRRRDAGEGRHAGGFGARRARRRRQVETRRSRAPWRPSTPAAEAGRRPRPPASGAGRIQRRRRVRASRRDGATVGRLRDLGDPRPASRRSR